MCNSACGDSFNTAPTIDDHLVDFLTQSIISMKDGGATLVITHQQVGQNAPDNS